jgi:large subunit ribosomal protein L26e
MKYSPTVSSSRRKARKAHFASDSESRRVLMSTHLSKDLREKHNVRAGRGLRGRERQRAVQTREA